MATDNKNIKITGELTLDPQVCKFSVEDLTFLEGTFNCRSKELAEGSPLLEALFGIDGITQVLVSGNTLTIAKSGPDAWQDFAKQIGAIVRDQIKSGKQLIASDVETKRPSEEHIRKAVEELFAKEINPAIASHGGKVELVDVKDSKVFVRLGGGCQGCASAHITLKHGIERAVRQVVPEVTEVVDATDHSAGSNPFYR